MNNKAIECLGDNGVCIPVKTELPKTNCDIPMPSYVKASGKTKECCDCIHRGVCAFSKEYENFCKEIEEKCKLLEYQHFSANMYCGFYRKEQPLTR